MKKSVQDAITALESRANRDGLAPELLDYLLAIVRDEDEESSVRVQAIEVAAQFLGVNSG